MNQIINQFAGNKKNIFSLDFILKYSIAPGLYLFTFFTGLIAIHFGHHWDEWVFISQANESIKNGTYLPSNYIYPSFCFYLVLFSGKLYLILHKLHQGYDLSNDYNFTIFLRIIFLSIASLTPVWTYFVAYKISKNQWIGIVSGLMVCSSFEYSYHTRWAVSDCLAVQFAILSALVLYARFSITVKVILSAVIVGFAAGTKYTAGIVILNTFMVIVLEKYSLVEKLKLLFLLTFFLVIAFAITTPGVFLDSSSFIRDIIWQKNVYANGHYGHTINPGWVHFKAIMIYISFSLFSRNFIISFIFFLMVLLGTFKVVKQKRWLEASLFFTMFIYIIYVSLFKVMIVRNLLYALPFFAIIASQVFEDFGKIKKSVFISFTITLIVVSSFYTIRASLSVFKKKNIDLKVELKKYIEENPDKTFILSKRVKKLIGHELMTGSNEKYIVFFNTEVPWELYEANNKDQFSAIVGVNDVNMNYYPTWTGIERILIMNYKNSYPAIIENTME